MLFDEVASDSCLILPMTIIAGLAFCGFLFGCFGFLFTITIAIASSFGFDAIHKNAKIGDARFPDKADIVCEELLNGEFVPDYIEHGIAIGAQKQCIGY